MSEPRKKPKPPARREPAAKRPPAACPSPPDRDADEPSHAEPECDKPAAEGDRGLDGFK